MAIKRKRLKPVKRRIKRRKSRKTSKVKRRKSARVPKGFKEVKKLPGFKPGETKRLKASLKKKEAELKRLKELVKKERQKRVKTEKKLRAARTKRQVQLLKERNKRRGSVTRLIAILNGLDEDTRIRTIREILSTANIEKEYWDLVKKIADELQITTHHVLLYMYIRL